VEIESAQDLEISVSDEGPGMSEEKLRELLEGLGPDPDKTQSEGAPEKVGMGIGLRYVRRVLESYYGGRAALEITSAPGRGTKARMSLPLRGPLPEPRGEAIAQARARDD
jgi:two-component system sensor histidine kinase YesM